MPVAAPRQSAASSTPKKLFIGLPIYSQCSVFFLQSMLALQKQSPCELLIHVCQGDGVARSRNRLTADFLKSDCTHLLFIDSDLVFHPDHVARIVEHDLPIVGGCYPKKQEGRLEWVLNTLPGAQIHENGLHKVRYIGTGFICVRRDVFERMIRELPEIAFKADYGERGEQHDFWSMGVYHYKDGSRRYLSEDWYFCQRWMDLGGDIWADTRIVLKHLGPAVYPLSYQEEELFSRAAPAGFFRERHKHWDSATWKEVVTDNVYGLPERFDPAAAVVDVGAHIGSFCFTALARGASRVYAYEPDRANFEKLSENVGKMRDNTRLRIYNLAVWPTPGQIEFHRLVAPGDNTGESSAVDDRFPVRPLESVSAISFEQVVAQVRGHGFERVAFLKMDCEGAEFDILATARIEDLQFVDHIAAELHPFFKGPPESGPAKAAVESIARRLSEAGFRVDLGVQRDHPHCPMLYGANKRLQRFSDPDSANGAPSGALAGGAPTLNGREPSAESREDDSRHSTLDARPQPA